MKLSESPNPLLATTLSELSRLQREVEEPWRKVGLDKSTYDAIIGNPTSMAAEVNKVFGTDSLGAMHDSIAKLSGSSSLIEASKHLALSDSMEEHLKDLSKASAMLEEAERNRRSTPLHTPTRFMPTPADLDRPYLESRARERRRLEIAEEQLKLQQEANRVLIAARDLETARADKADREKARAVRFTILAIFATLVTGGGAIWLMVRDSL